MRDEMQIPNVTKIRVFLIVSGREEKNIKSLTITYNESILLSPIR